MDKNDYIKLIKKRIKGGSRKVMLDQIERYYNAYNFVLPKHNYKKDDDVLLKKGTLLHGTFKNIEGLRDIVQNGLIASLFINERESKYPGAVGVWNLKEDYYLKDYINFYSGGTIEYSGVLEEDIRKTKTDIVPYDKMSNILDIVTKVNCHKWMVDQTKEARFLPSLIQDKVQIGIIFNADNEYVKEFLKGDLLNGDNVSDKDAKPFVNAHYYQNFIVDRKNKDDLFTDRESAILFGIPSNFIEGILVGRQYENDKEMLEKIKELLPNCYICNLDGKVIVI